MKIYIVHYNASKGQFILHTPGYDKPEFIDRIILRNVVFFVAPSCPQIIRLRAQTMTPSKAKFPHAFALCTEREPTMSKARDRSLAWEHFEYNVFVHNAFVFSETQEPIISPVQYLMLHGDTQKVVR